MKIYILVLRRLAVGAALSTPAGALPLPLRARATLLLSLLLRHIHAVAAVAAAAVVAAALAAGAARAAAGARCRCCGSCCSCCSCWSCSCSCSCYICAIRLSCFGVRGRCSVLRFAHIVFISRSYQKVLRVAIWTSHFVDSEAAVVRKCFVLPYGHAILWLGKPWW